MELKTRRPVSAELRESRITSTRLVRGRAAVERQQLAHQRKGDARRGDIVFARALVFGEGLDALAFEQRVAVLHVEQRTRGDRDDERLGGCGFHAGIVPRGGRRPREPARR